MDNFISLDIIKLREEIAERYSNRKVLAGYCQRLTHVSIFYTRISVSALHVVGSGPTRSR